MKWLKKWGYFILLIERNRVPVLCDHWSLCKALRQLQEWYHEADTEVCLRSGSRAEETWYLGRRHFRRFGQQRWETMQV